MTPAEIQNPSIYVILKGNDIWDTVEVIGYCHTKEKAEAFLGEHPRFAPDGGVYADHYYYEQVELL